MVTLERIDDGVGLRRYNYDDSQVLAADFGPGGDVAVDVVDGTVIVVDDGEQYEIAFDGDAQAFIRNGVLTIEVNE